MSFLEDIQDKIQKFLESEKGQKLQKKAVNFGVKISKKIENLPDGNPIKKAVKKMYKGNPNLSSTQGLREVLSIRNQDVQNQDKPEQFPVPNILRQKENLKDKLSPEKWAKRVAKIKRNTKKLMLKAGNISAKLMILQTKIVAKTTKGAGLVAKGAGYAMRTAAYLGKGISKAASFAGKGLKMGGSALQKGCMAATKATARIPYVGPVLAAVPAIGVGVGATLNGVGMGLDKGGMAAEKGCDAFNKAGKSVVNTGDKLVQASKKTEMAAKRMDKIRKYYMQKSMSKIKHEEVQSKIEDVQKQQQIMRLKNPLAYEAAQKETQHKSAPVNMAALMKNKGKEM